MLDDTLKMTPYALEEKANEHSRVNMIKTKADDRVVAPADDGPWQSIITPPI